LQFYVNALRDLVILTSELLTLEPCHVMPCGCSFANFEVEITNYVSRVSATAVFHLPPA